VGRRWTSATRPRLRRRDRDEARDADPSQLGQRSGDQRSGDGEGTQRSSDLGSGDGGGGFGVGDLLDGDSLAIGLVLVVVLGLLFFLVFPLLEAVVVLLAGTAVFRIVLRRPWRVEARSTATAPAPARTGTSSASDAPDASPASVAEHIAATGELPERPAGALPERVA
jgi:hypothetical protein